MISKKIIEYINSIQKEQYEESDNIRKLHSLHANKAVYNYLSYLLRYLFIETFYAKGSAAEMINNNELNGLCYSSNEAMIPFFKKNDEIVRGIVHPSSYSKINHSYIRFKFLNETYIFDTSIGVIVKEKYYKEIWKSEEIAIIKSKVVSDKFIEVIKNNDNDKLVNVSTGDIYSPIYKQEIKINGTVNHNKIKNLKVYLSSQI